MGFIVMYPNKLKPIPNQPKQEEKHSHGTSKFYSTLDTSTSLRPLHHKLVSLKKVTDYTCRYVNVLTNSTYSSFNFYAV